MEVSLAGDSPPCPKDQGYAAREWPSNEGFVKRVRGNFQSNANKIANDAKQHCAARARRKAKPPGLHPAARFL